MVGLKLFCVEIIESNFCIAKKNAYNVKGLQNYCNYRLLNIIKVLANYSIALLKALLENCFRPLAVFGLKWERCVVQQFLKLREAVQPLV